MNDKLKTGIAIPVLMTALAGCAGNTLKENNTQYVPVNVKKTQLNIPQCLVKYQGGIVSPKHYMEVFNEKFKNAETPEEQLEIRAEVQDGYFNLGEVDKMLQNCSSDKLPSNETKVTYAMNHGLLKGCDFLGDAFDPASSNNVNMRDPRIVTLNGLIRNECRKISAEKMFPEKTPSEIVDIVALGSSFADPLLGAGIALGNRVATFGYKIIDGDTSVNSELEEQLVNYKFRILDSDVSVSKIAEVTSNYILPATRVGNWGFLK